MGVRIEVETCSPGIVTTASCAVTGTGDKIRTDALQVRGASPFTVYSLPVCSPIGYLDEARTIAQNALTYGEARAVEREFWTGALGTTPHLAANAQVTDVDGTILQTAATVLVTGGAVVDAVEGLARLEEALGWCYGSEGVIHAPNSVVTHWEAYGLLRHDGTRLRSPSGHIVVSGNGYPGTAPDGTAPGPGTRWVYATGAIQLRRGPIEMSATNNSEMVDRAKNDIVLVAERTYVIDWDCCHLAIQIKIGGQVPDAFNA
jgi:hypothetical protein